MEITTGYASIDKSWEGLKQGELVLIAARPGMGKTTLLINMAQKANKNQKCVFLALEHAKVSLEKRFGPMNFSIYDKVDTRLAELADIIDFEKPKLIFIDYLQLLSERDSLLLNLKKIARDKSVCIIAGSQLSREAEMRGIEEIKPRPDDLLYVLSDGAQLSEVDKIGLLFRNEYYRIEVPEDERNMLEIECHQRAGASPTIVKLKISDDWRLIN